MSPPPPSIAKALVEAQKAVKSVGKASVNEHHGYAYASAQDVAAEAQRALNGAGLALCRIGWAHVPITEKEPARLEVSYVLTCTSGESWLLPPVSVPSLPGKGRPEDKAEAAALTYSAGYVAQGLLQIERVDEHDVDARDDRAPAPIRDEVAEAIGGIVRGDQKAKDWVKASWEDFSGPERDAVHKAIEATKKASK